MTIRRHGKSRFAQGVWISITALLLIAGVAGAQPLEADAKTAHAEADLNGDGVIDHREYHMRMVDVFYFADGNRDGFLVAGEFEQTGRKDPAAGDADGNGKVSMKEFLDEAFDRFEAADTNEDDQLSLVEIEAAYAQ